MTAEALDLLIEAGLEYVYLGNVFAHELENTCSEWRGRLGWP
jgi:hypothetical protein